VETVIFNKENFVAWAAFKALTFYFDNYYAGSDPVLNAARMTSLKIVNATEAWLSQYLLGGDDNSFISQGGHLSFNGVWLPFPGDKDFCVECFTWGVLAFGSKNFDLRYRNKTTAYNVWEETKKLSGYYESGTFAGLGYGSSTWPASPTTIWSGEWTWSAILLTTRLADEYKKEGKLEWAQNLQKDATSMLTQIQKAVVPDKDGVRQSGGLAQADGSYLYTTKHSFIPWGWFANPIGSTSTTAWAVFKDQSYNPFLLGGYYQDSPFWTQQCKDNRPNPSLFQELARFYNY